MAIYGCVYGYMGVSPKCDVTDWSHSVSRSIEQIVYSLLAKVDHIEVYLTKVTLLGM
jgi:hypothetical protein